LAFAQAGNLKMLESDGVVWRARPKALQWAFFLAAKEGFIDILK